MNIQDNQRLVSARFAHGTPIAIYDDGFGPLWIHRDSMGVSGIVRARTWESAYSICEDELFQPGDEDANADRLKIEAMPEGEDRNHAEDCWAEAYGYRGNGRKEADGTVSYVYAKDLNGDRLDDLTPALIAEIGIVLEIETEA